MKNGQGKIPGDLCRGQDCRDVMTRVSISKSSITGVIIGCGVEGYPWQAFHVGESSTR